jgi:hypothetical protein
MRKIKTFKLFEANEFGDTGFKSDISHIKMIMSDIKDDGIDFRVIPGERDFPDEKDNIYIKIFNIPWGFCKTTEGQLNYFDRKWKQLIGEIGDLYKLDYVRITDHNSGIVRSYKFYEEFYKWVNDNKGGMLLIYLSTIDFEFSSLDGKDVF